MSSPTLDRGGRAGRFDQHLVATLHAILQTGSISKAALVLGVSQPAVSQALRKLRAHFGDELFVRSGQGLLPTQRMLALQPVVERLLRDLEMLSRPPEGVELRDVELEFIVCMSEIVEFAVLPQVAAEFMQHMPRSRLRGVRAHHAQLLSMLEQGEADLAVGSLVGAAPSLRQQRLADHRMVCLVSAEGRWAEQPPSLQDYAESRHVAVQRLSDQVDPVSERLRLTGVRRDAVITVSSDFAAARIVAATDALGTVAYATGRQLASLFPVKQHPLPFDAGTFRSRMIWHERFQRDTSHIWVRKRVEEAFTRWAHD